MNNIILDVGSDVNILPKKTWEQIRKPKMVWSPIHLRLENQYKVYPIGQMEDMELNTNGVKSKEDFKVIDITNDT